MVEDGRSKKRWCMDVSPKSTGAGVFHDRGRHHLLRGAAAQESPHSDHQFTMSDGKKIDITKLEPEQIIQLRKQFENELEHFTTSLDALNMALTKFSECARNVKQVSQKENDGKQILVPLSGSLYVPGKIKDNDKFLVDVGTGYYVEKSADKAIAFYEAKIAQLNKDSIKVTEIIQEKSATIQRVDQVLREKVAQREQQQQQAAKTTSST